jgi:hypothetical protein
MDLDSRTIFIGIGAYNEFFLEQTVRNCIEMASHPERLVFGIWSHNNDGVLPSFPDLNNVKIITAQYPSLLGVCPSRTGALFLYNNEDYYLQIDAHMLFQKNWDKILISSYENIKVKENLEFPLITTYVPWWIKNKEGSIEGYNPESEEKAYPITYDRDSYTWAPVPVQMNIDIDWSNKEYVEHYGLSAHFIFTRGEFVYSILPDIQMMFFGEEMTTAVRAWTRGYRIFCIPDPIAWHYNKDISLGEVYEYDRQMAIGDPSRFQDFEEKQARSWDRTRKILTGEILGYWGATTKEALKKYTEAANINFVAFYEKLDKLKNINVD